MIFLRYISLVVSATVAGAALAAIATYLIILVKFDPAPLVKNHKIFLPLMDIPTLLGAILGGSAAVAHILKARH